MRISGHKAASIFRRYDIVDECDLIEAAKKIESSQLSYRQAKIEQNASVDENAKDVQNVSVQ